MKLPKKITPCPIIESVVEIRYDSSIPSEATFGVIYNYFKDLFPKEPENLPITQLPAKIRNNDPNLLYKPHYRLSDETFLFQVGPKSISVINKGEYVGWNIFSQKIIECFKKAKEIQIIKNTKRFGLRYINFFENVNIYNKTNFKLLLNEKSFIKNNTILKTTISNGEYTCNFRVSNNSKIEDSNIKKEGSIIDIDVYREENGIFIVEHFDNILKEAHEIEKELFFSSLKKNFLEKFNPEY